MDFDLLIKNGRIVDGSGLVSYVGDVGVKGGKIVAKGKVKGTATRTIDATGLVVSPGFIDMHTHYDAQFDWDPYATPSSWHGVTTVVMGHCGFSLAPVAPADHEFIMQMFGNVEGVPKSVLEKGLTWQWKDYRQFLGHLDGKIGVNAAGNVGHSAVRYAVMGDQSLDRAARPDEIQKMKSLVHESLKAGAWGFTTSLAPSHNDSFGRPVPSRQATDEEVLELATVLAEFPRGGIEIIPRTLFSGFQESDRVLMTQMSLQSGKQVNWNELSQTTDYPTLWREQLDFMEEARNQGAQVYGVSRCNRNERDFTLKMTTLFDRYPRWKEFVKKPKAEKYTALKDQDYRRKLLEELDDPAVAAKQLRRRQMDQIKVLATAKDAHRSSEDRTLGELAKKQGKHFGDVMLDLAIDEDFETQFASPATTNTDEEAVRAIITHPNAIVGISDGGAHVVSLTGASFPTLFLSYWVRQQHVMSLEQGIRRLTFMPASLMGFQDRGLIREGMAADITVFALDELGMSKRYLAHDLPGDAPRYIQDSHGYEYLIVNGQVAFEDGKNTGALAGKVLRSSDYD